MSTLLTISYGDTETGPELLEAALSVLAEAGGMFEIETIQLGEELVKLGYDQGFSEDELRKIHCSHILFIAPTKENITKNLCEALQIPDVRETYGTAQAYLNDEYAIFEPSDLTPSAMLDTAIMLLKHTQQIETAERIKKALKSVDPELPTEKFIQAVIAKLWTN